MPIEPEPLNARDAEGAEEHQEPQSNRQDAKDAKKNGTRIKSKANDIRLLRAQGVLLVAQLVPDADKHSLNQGLNRKGTRLGRMCTVHLIGPGVHIRGAPGEPKREAQHAAPPVRTLCVGDTASAVTGGHRLAPDFAKALVSGLERHRTPRPDTPPARFPSSQRGFDSPHPLSSSRGISAGDRRFSAVPASRRSSRLAGRSGARVRRHRQGRQRLRLTLRCGSGNRTSR